MTKIPHHKIYELSSRYKTGAYKCLLLKKICPKIVILYMASYQIFEDQKKEKETKYREQREIANHTA